MAGLCGPALVGCSFLYNPNNLPDIPGEAGPADAAIVLDANPSLLELVDISPREIDEGQGDLGSAPALLVLRGHQMVNSNLKVALMAAGRTLKVTPITDAKASFNGDFIAFSVTSRVDNTLATTVPVDIVVTEDVPEQYGGGTVTRTLSNKLTLRGLPELTSANTAIVDKNAKLIKTPLGDRYSMIDVADVTPATIQGTMPATFNAVSSIKLGAIVASATGTAPGAGGSAGGNADGTGPGGGKHGGDASLSTLAANGGGGGGGGAAAAGDPGMTGTSVLLGAGGTGGAGGPRTGDDQLLSLDAPSAGGAGGQGGLLVVIEAGGSGGAGAGMVVLSAGGNISAGAIAANGGNGASKGGGGGGGGGGAGGTVVVRTSHGTLQTGTINVKGGAAGTPKGGAGSVGRVRWEAPAGAAPSSPDRAPYRGPAFIVPLGERVFTTDRPMLALAGTPSNSFTIRVTDQDNAVHDGGRGSFNSQGVAMIDPLLYPGRNQVCIVLDGRAQSPTEADKCLDVAYLP
jgi:hypothetical protein